MATEEALEGFLLHIESAGLALSTQKHYKADLLKFLESAPDSVTDISPEHIERHLTSLQKAEYKASSINTALMSLKSFFAFLEERFELPNPARKIKKLRELPRNQRLISEDDYNKLMQYLTDYQKDCILMLENTGLRSSELLNLRPENFRNGFITVVGKGKKLKKIPINNTVKEILARNPNLQFLKSKSTHWLYKRCCKISKRANIKHFSAHSLRHRFCTRMIANGIPRDKVAMIMGITVHTLETVYLHLSESDLQGATDCLA